MKETKVMHPPGRAIKTLLFSTLYPSSARPVHGIFVENRLRELLKTGAIETKVVAPVPWFPSASEHFGEYGRFAATPRHEKYNGIEVHHPRYFLPPKIGMNIAPYAIALAALPTIKRLIAEGFDFDLIDAHYYYPDGVAAGIIADKLRKPFVVTARGTDLNLIPQYSHPRQLILITAEKAYASIGVCKALMDSLANLGAKENKLHVFRNGVDLLKFQPEDQALARQRLDLPAKRILLSVGHLVERKGHDIAIRALAELPEDTYLVIAGSGPERSALELLAQSLQLSGRVRFAGQVVNSDLRWWYSAADALVLCSSREGWANVLLESMACGTPVVASNIWGTPEVVSCATAGRLMPERTPAGLAVSVIDLLNHYPDRAAVRQFAEQFSWDETSIAQRKLFDSIVRSKHS